MTSFCLADDGRAEGFEKYVVSDSASFKADA